MATTVKWYGDEVRKNIEADVDAKLRIGCEWVLDEARRLMAEPKHGTPPPSGRKNENWVVARSKGGEAPAAQTSRLQGALTVGHGNNILKRIKRGWWRVGTNVEYHLPLERPTGKGQVKVARPLMEPALARAWPKIKALFRAS